MRRLEMLTLRSRRRFATAQSGDRRSSRRGLSIEFMDYREYRPGDDLRYVDWKAYGRLERLFLKLFLDEEDLHLHLLVDCSKSMSFGAPLTKQHYALQAAAAIGFIALHGGGSRVDIAAPSKETPVRSSPLRGDSSIPTFLRYLESLDKSESTVDFAASVRQYAVSAPPAGLIIVFSDFLDPEIEVGLSSLSARKHQVVLARIFSPFEVQPRIAGDFNLIDSETGISRQVTVTDYELNQYAQALTLHTTWLQSIAHKYEMDLVTVVTDEPIEQLVIGSLRTAGLIS